MIQTVVDLLLELPGSSVVFWISSLALPVLKRILMNFALHN